MEYEILETRDDGSFVIQGPDGPFQVTPDYCPELWKAVCAQQGLGSDTQAEKYRAATQTTT